MGSVDRRRLASLTTPLLAAAALAASACATPTPSAELMSARNAFEDTKKSRANQLVPDRVLEAEQALKKAEAAHLDDPQSEMEKHFSYLAERRALIARAYGDISAAEKEKIAAEERYLTTLDEKRRSAESSAEKASGELARTSGELARTSGELARERAARLEAERKMQAALKSLEEIANIKEEARGMVITLSGAVLFASDKSELLPIAKERLDQVAVALQNTDPSQTMVVEGHTDSVGVDAYNQTLSEDRAKAVRDHLVSKGVEANRISAVGKGESVAISDNTSPEGRANNRRVEIIVSPPKKKR